MKLIKDIAVYIILVAISLELSGCAWGPCGPVFTRNNGLGIEEKPIDTSTHGASLDSEHYRVALGDSSLSIARMYGLSLSNLAEFNPDVNWSRLRTGQVIRIRAATDNKAPNQISEPKPNGVAQR